MAKFMTERLARQVRHPNRANRTDRPTAGLIAVVYAALRGACMHREAVGAIVEGLGALAVRRTRASARASSPSVFTIAGRPERRR